MESRLRLERYPTLARLEPGTAKSVGQCLTYEAYGNIKKERLDKNRIARRSVSFTYDPTTKDKKAKMSLS